MMNWGLIIAIIIGILAGITIPEIMRRYKYAGRVLILAFMIALSLIYWKQGKIRDAYIYFEITVWLLFGLADYLEEFGIKTLLGLLLIAVGILGLTLYEFKMTITDVLGLIVSSGVALYGFVYLGYLVNERRNPEKVKKK
jgi:hypothetical protein